MKLVLATRNRDKIKEIRAILEDLDLELVEVESLAGVSEVEETGNSLEENAVLKAREVARATGLPALADDSGLEVRALGGAPGVYSSRFAGDGATYEDNWRLLLEKLREVPDEEREAQFRCVIALCLPGEPDRVLASEGILYGRILREARGELGFGYDPVFLVAEAAESLAELEPAEKNRISHRYRALVEMKYLLQTELGVENKPDNRAVGSGKVRRHAEP